MILFTDGLQNAGAETAEAVLPDLRANGVRVYTIGLGNDQDAVLLTNIATTTGATYFPIDGDLSAGEAATAITEALVQIAGESRENGGIVSFNPIDGASPDGAAADKAAPFDWHFGQIERPSVDRSAPLVRVHRSDHAGHHALHARRTLERAEAKVRGAGQRSRRQRGRRGRRCSTRLGQVPVRFLGDR